MKRKGSIFCCFLLFVWFASFCSIAEEDGGSPVEMTFSGELSLATCTVIVPEPIVALPNVMVSDFDSIAVGDIYGDKEFSVRVGECTGGGDVIHEVHLKFEALNDDINKTYQAFSNEIEGPFAPYATGLASVVVDDRNDQNVITQSGNPYDLVYDPEIFPIGSDYKFVAHYVKTAEKVTSGVFLTEIIITADYN